MFSLVMYSGLHALVPSLNALFPNNTSINLVVLPWCYYRHIWCCWSACFICVDKIKLI